MSVLLEFAMFPTDKGESVSEYVSRIIQTIDESGFPYSLTAMGTIVEVDRLDEALDVVRKAYEQLEGDCSRVYSSIKLDIRKGKSRTTQTKDRLGGTAIGKETRQIG